MLRVREKGGKPPTPVADHPLAIDAASRPLRLRAACPLPASRDGTGHCATLVSVENKVKSPRHCRYLRRNWLLFEGCRYII